MGKGSNKTTTTSQQSYTPDPRISQAAGQAITGAESAAQLPFQMPAAPVAGFSPFQEQAFGQTQAAQGMSLPYFANAANLMQGSAAPISAGDVEQYYNPFAQNVTNQLQNIFGQQNRMATSNAVRAAGGVGADRIGVAQGNLANQQGLAAGQIYSGLYDKALAAAQQNKQMQAGAGFGMGQLGPAAQASYLQGTGALGQAGGMQQALQQQQQNALYQQRLAEIAYPFQTPQYLAGITGGLAPALGGSTYGTSTTEKPQPSPLNQILGIGGALLGTALGGPMGGMMGGSIGKGAGSMFGGGGGETAGYGPGSMSYYGGVPYYQGYRRGGRLSNPFASGGAAYGKIAEQRFANSPVGNPYADSTSSDESDDSNYAEGGDVEERPPLPGTRPMPMDTTSIVPKIPMHMGAGHAGAKLDLRPPPEEKQGGSDASAIASTAMKLLPMMMAARGGAVNPFDTGMGFQEGGFADDMTLPEPEPMQGMDAPMGNTNPHWSIGDIASRAGDFYSDKLSGLAPNPQSPLNVQKYMPKAANLFGEAKAEPPLEPPIRQAREGIAGPASEEQQNPFGGDEIPLPRGNPRTVGGVKATMANEWSRAGMSPTGLAGINMNVADESQFDPGSRHFDQPNQRFRGTEAQNAHGLYQEGGDEWNNYVGWLKKNRPDYNWDDPALQSRFTAQNLRENYPEVWKAMQNAKTPGEAADAFLRGYLKPATQHLAARSRRYLGGEGGEGDDTIEMSGKPRNPFVLANRDMQLGDYERSPNRPYPDSTKRDWGQNLARSPWGALVVGGARMAQTTGPVGSALGAGIEAGMGHLSGQRKELRTEEDMNMKADALFQHAKTHLDKYQRMTPYESEISKWREATNERKGMTAHQRDAQWYVDNGIAPDLKAAVEMLKTGVNTAAGYARMVENAKKTILQANPGMDENDAEIKARERVRERGALNKPQPAKPMPTNKADLEIGERYATPRGEATWDGEKFVT